MGEDCLKCETEVRLPAGLEAVLPVDGLQALQAMLASALDSRLAAMRPLTNVVCPIHWPNLLRSSARATSALFAEFQVHPSPIFVTAALSS